MSTPHSRGSSCSESRCCGGAARRLDNPAVQIGRPVLACASLLTVAACSPGLDWREFRSPESGIAVLFPCRPSTQQRAVTIAGRKTRLSLHACRAGDVTWAMAEADVGDPAWVERSLVDLRNAAAANVSGRVDAVVPFEVEGATPNLEAKRCAIAGKLPDGQAVAEHLGVFAVGTRVAQVTALGASTPAEAVNTFFESARVRK